MAAAMSDDHGACAPLIQYLCRPAEKLRSEGRVLKCDGDRSGVQKTPFLSLNYLDAVPYLNAVPY
jgi:hypothetical protein